MRKFFLFLSILLVFNILDASCPRKKKGTKRNPKELEEVVITPNNPITAYRGSYTKYFDLLHTTLTIKPVFKEKALYGLAELTLKPHFYNQQQLVLDAKYFKINNVQLKTTTAPVNLKYTYDTTHLKIDLGKPYTQNEEFTVMVDYVALPYTQDSAQVENGRGMYFIDVENKNPYKPMHLWTQGEEESASCWFPTIDATNQKTTEEIYVTLDTNMVSLSNGLLINTKVNGDGTKTDYWKQDKPHSPYLFFLGIGDYFIHKDTWRGKEVSAYTFPKYKDAVGEIFKNMPAMMEYFSTITGVDFPWDKMANIMAYDYTSGAMENTSAILYFDKLLCNHQQLIDGDFDWIIAHELFHQWFGDLVTAESWANLTLNESFADYSEYLWYNHQEGKNIGDAYRFMSSEKYLNASNYKNEPIVNYYYNTPHDIFDVIRYEKGGAVLHLLRNYVGDSAFFSSLKKYLTTFKFGNTELSDFRKVVEDITGEDLNWFFNQWWKSQGHPILEITPTYDEKNKTIQLAVKQIQKNNFGPIFRIPTKVDIYVDGKVERKSIEINDRINVFYFAASTKPQLVNFDADKVLLCEKKENLSDSENIFKFNNAPLFVDKIEALRALAPKQKNNPAIQEILLKALQNENWYLRAEAINLIAPDKFSNKTTLSLAFQNIIQTDSKSKVREKAIKKISLIDKKNSADIYKYVLENDSSFLCLSTALSNISDYKKTEAYHYAAQFTSTENQDLMIAIANIFKDTTADNLDFFKKAVWLSNYNSSYYAFKAIGEYLEKCNNFILEKGILFLNDIYQYEESDFMIQGAEQVVKNLKQTFSERAKKDAQADIKVQIIKKSAKTILR
ncbi:MAG: hypothetical protein RJA25_2017 [Bacteroidota bacterium]|jgi:aminopeptidase N